MTNSINGILPSGLTAIARVYASGWVQKGADVTLAEVSPRLYTGMFDLTTLSDGIYSVIFWDGTEPVNAGVMEVVDGVEVLPAGASTLADIATEVTEINNRSMFIASEVRD